jgi:quercetin dioxygenase-like cupin family protein
MVLIGMEPGQQLGEHQVRETAYLVVVSGTVEVEAGGESLRAAEGTLLRFERGEEHAVGSADGARLLLVLAPWPAADHYPAGRGG